MQIQVQFGFKLKIDFPLNYSTLLGQVISENTVLSKSLGRIHSRNMISFALYDMHMSEVILSRY